MPNDKLNENIALDSGLRGILRHDEPLARYTSWHVGGRAKQSYRPADLADLIAFLALIANKKNSIAEQMVWLGLGSNVLIRDGGILGTVIITQNRLNKMAQTGDGTIRVEAGVPCAKLAKYCAQLGFAAGAFFSGVPGTVGGALAMNAGAFGGETWTFVVAVETINRHGEIKIRSPKDFQVGYRHVVRPEGEWFVAGHFVFPSGKSEIAQQAIRELLRKRSDTQPIGEFSCGSVFRNPTNDHAARLIEACGLKGFRQGGAKVSEKHANFIINDANATAKDIEILIQIVQQHVEEIHKVKLITEVHILGEP